ncbi:hypothetical protein EDE12_10214 [Methylosinus sp. sav-2]|uniref:hypothetical protein n=1 Tax=Methylosinus sp. sav-2 TaxID=2485168 RepID=UPI00047D7B9B|nr:hypothetical protein [Methylosinus sp. sav-2]TDX65529.1 hypothetical protein EDE12_10214 [Methylosinus sp. sav-2]
MLSRLLALTLAIAPLTIDHAAAICWFGCPDPTEANARQIFDNLLKQRFDKPGKILSFKQTMTERLEMHATGEKGFELFFNASVQFPDGANLECKPDDAGKFPEGCSPSKHYVTAPRNSDPKGKQYIAPGETIVFDEEYRFYADGDGWKGPDGVVYKQ